MEFGIVGTGRIVMRILKRIKPFDVKLHYTQRVRIALEHWLSLSLSSLSSLSYIVL